MKKKRLIKLCDVTVQRSESGMFSSDHLSEAYIRPDSVLSVEVHPGHVTIHCPPGMRYIVTRETWTTLERELVRPEKASIEADAAPGVYRDERIFCVNLYANGMVAVFNRDLEQIPRYQGRYSEVIESISLASGSDPVEWTCITGCGRRGVVGRDPICECAALGENARKRHEAR